MDDDPNIKKVTKKVAHIRVVGEDDFTVKVMQKPPYVSITRGFLNEEPDGSAIVDNKCIVNIVEGIETPVEAYFAGHMRAAATTQDMVLAYNLFISMVQATLESPRLQKLWDSYRISRIGRAKVQSLFKRAAILSKPGLSLRSTSS